jgi:hypothetical protein
MIKLEDFSKEKNQPPFSDKSSTKIDVTTSFFENPSRLSNRCLDTRENFWRFISRVIKWQEPAYKFGCVIPYILDKGIGCSLKE